jgi:hypothetical protein
VALEDKLAAFEDVAIPFRNPELNLNLTLKISQREICTLKISLTIRDESTAYEQDQ